MLEWEDNSDLKSDERMLVAVRVRLPAPFPMYLNGTCLVHKKLKVRFEVR